MLTKLVGWFKGTQPEDAKTPAVVQDVKLAPFKGLDLKVNVRFNNNEIALLQGETLIDVEGCAETMVIQSKSIIDLGAGTKWERFYTDHAYFQVAYTGDAVMDNVEVLKIVVYEESAGLGSQDAVDEIFERMKQDTFEYKGVLFTSAYKVEFSESVVNPTDTYAVQNQLCVFKRTLSNGTTEYLYVALEESDGVTLSYALGIELPFTRIETLTF